MQNRPMTLPRIEQEAWTACDKRLTPHSLPEPVARNALAERMADTAPACLKTRSCAFGGLRFISGELLRLIDRYSSVGWPHFPSTTVLASRNKLFATFGDKSPIDDMEERGHVFRSPVLVFEIIGMFPHVNAQQWLLALADR